MALTLYYVSGSPYSWTVQMALAHKRAEFASRLISFDKSEHKTAFPRFERREPELGLSGLIGPRLRAWMGRIEALPYFEKTYPPHWRA